MNNNKKEGGMCYSREHSRIDDVCRDDPRIVALVRFIARRAAEADYKELLRAIEGKSETQDDRDS